MFIDTRGMTLRPAGRAADTRGRLIDGAIETLRRHGYAATSARSIAATAGVNQALIFYHFGSVDELLAAACRQTATAQAQLYAARLASAATVREVLAAGRTLPQSPVVQLLSGARTNGVLAAACNEAVARWTALTEEALRRRLRRSDLADRCDLAGLARALTATAIGLELYDGVDAVASAQAIVALDQLAALTDAAAALGVRRAARSRIGRAAQRRRVG
jgi:AcrR family transcriptional regulator